jgi:hypothetical protein
MMIWLTLLPSALVSTCGLATIPLCGFVAFLLLGEPPRGSMAFDEGMLLHPNDLTLHHTYCWHGPPVGDGLPCQQMVLASPPLQSPHTTPETT